MFPTNGGACPHQRVAFYMREKVKGMTEAQHDQETPNTIPSREQRNQPSASPPRQIFREQALQHYIQKNEQTVLPRTISPFVFTCCWIVLALVTLVGFFIWSIPVPNYVNTPGMLVVQESPADTTQTTSVRAFFPLSAQAYIQPGQTVQVGGPALASPLPGRITGIDTQHLATTELSNRYALSPALVQSLPVSVVFVGTITTSQAIPLENNDISNRVLVRYQQGTRQALALLLDRSNP